MSQDDYEPGNGHEPSFFRAAKLWYGKHYTESPNIWKNGKKKLGKFGPDKIAISAYPFWSPNVTTVSRNCVSQFFHMFGGACTVLYGYHGLLPQ